jgi:peptidoglycan glycosyltransferase
MNESIRRLSLVLLLAFLLLAGSSGYWAVLRGSDLWDREDNPRLVEAEQKAQRGAILDRHGETLAYSHLVAEVQQRVYLEPEAAPAVGYYNLKHGVGGIEAAYDELLRGLQDRSQWDRFLDRLLHRRPAGRDVRLTIDAGLQSEIDELLGERAGAVVLLDPISGELLAMVSHPSYDPNTLDDDWEALEQDPAAPLLNRVTQGLYQPGGALQLPVLAAALQADLINLDTPVPDVSQTVTVDDQKLGCARQTSGSTLAQAVAAACPAPLASLGESLGSEALAEAFRQWGLHVPPPLEIPTEAGEIGSDTPSQAAVGQGELTVSPLRMGLILSALANQGVIPAPRLVLETENPSGEMIPEPVKGQATPALSPDLARQLRQAMRLSDDEESLGHSSLALASADKPPHTWYLGLAPAKAPRYVVVVLLEHGGREGLSQAQKIGQQALATALAQTP